MRYGPLIAGVAGGIVSSTVTTLDLARRAKKAGKDATSLLAGACAAAATMFVRVIVVVALFGPKLLLALALPLGIAALVMAASAVLLDQPWRSVHTDAAGAKAAPVSNPFEFRTALVFSLLLGVITLLSAFLTETFGGAGGVVLAAVAGISDVDAITLSMTRVGGASVSLAAAEVAILTAVTTNSLAKIVLAFVAGGRPFAVRYGAVTLVALAAGGLAALLEEWSF
jgi:uncharacterized membrane protein (DUF4010 family)